MTAPAADPGDLCLVADVKSWLGLDVATDNAMLQRLVTAASEDIRSECNRIFNVDDYIEIRNGVGFGSQVFVTKQWPINSVSSVLIDSEAVPDGSGAADGCGYFYTNYTSGAHVYLVGYDFTEGVSNIEVHYNAGYATVPADLAQACIDLVSYRYRSRTRIGESSKILAGENVNYITSHMPDTVRRVIQRYSRVIPV